MTVDHHLDDATLLQYASGVLDIAFSSIIAAHLAMCDECRHAVRTAEEVGGALLSEANGPEMSAGSFELLMHKIDNTSSNDNPIKITQTIPADADVPAPLVRYIGPYLNAIRWKCVAPGVRKFNIKQDSKSSFYMLSISPGTAVPEHSHGGAELTLVLSGMYTDALGAFKPGDIADLDEHVEHQPMVDGDEPCICIVATEAPTQFKDLFSRLLQPLIGI